MQMFCLFGILTLFFVTAGCSRSDSTQTSTSTDSSTALTPTSRSNEPSSIIAGVTNAVDNTARNVRDRVDTALTPTDQGGSPADRQLTANIRQAVEKDSSLSTEAKNIKIITVNGKVTLRGPVNSASEKKTIEGIAQNLAGTTTVDDQLEVKATNQ